MCLKTEKYSSYQGKISPSVTNELQRDFHADKPNEKWLTDITEFAIPAGKVYLSPNLELLRWHGSLLDNRDTPGFILGEQYA